MQFRRADGADISQMINMRLAYLSEDYDGLTEEQTSAIKSQLSDYFKKHLNQDLIVFVCEDGNAIVSTVFLLIVERPANPGYITGLTGTILNVYTLPQYRKRGLAGSLMKMAIEEAKCRNLSYLDLKATQAGYSLYRKLGFAPDESKYVSMKYIVNQNSQGDIIDT
ncbi:MAG TPA: GNAT family N-acetyltransferase [Clostridiales bacterium]|nr:GNAT family N-acetyltransferase [Clostridiales bacterium]